MPALARRQISGVEKTSLALACTPAEAGRRAASAGRWTQASAPHTHPRFPFGSEIDEQFILMSESSRTINHKLNELLSKSTCSPGHRVTHVN